MESEDSIEIYDNFDNMKLNDNLLRGIYSHGFETPSVIQQKVIVPFISGRDIIAQSQSGTGKTGAFTIGCLARIELNKRSPQALILSPTRELAEQTNRVFEALNVN